MESPGITRKLAAILSADVQGYSRLMGADEEATIRTLTSYRETMSSLIERHRGRVVDSPGDNLLAEFSSVVDALRCAVAVQQELAVRNQQLPSQRQMRFRIGINLGDVIVQGERIYGDGVNIAARLESLAEGGGICIAGSVYDQVENKVALTYEFLGEQHVKNIARPVRVYRVRSPSSPAPPVASIQYSVASREEAEEENQKAKIEGRSSLPDLRSPLRNTQTLVPNLVGRDAELHFLRGTLAKALGGQRQVVFVSGEPGIGKTTLVEQFLTSLEDRRDIRIARGQCIEQYGAGEAYLPLLEATHRLCREPGGERIVEQLKRYAPTWLVQLSALIDPQELEQLSLRIQGANRERMLREMTESAELFSARRALVLVLEDLHWSDTATLEWISYIARRRGIAKFCLLGTYRPMEALATNHSLRGIVQDLRTQGQCVELRLTSLAEEAVAEYLSGRFVGAALPAELAKTIHRRTEGNPLFIVNMTDYLSRQGVVVEEAGQWIVKGERFVAIEEGVPDSLRQLIERQVERLSEAEQRLLEVASVVGVEFTLAAVAAGLRAAVEEIEEHYEKLAKTGQFIQERGIEEWPDGTIGGRYQFLHALYQNVCYERIASGRRVRLHKQIADRREAAFGARAGEIAAELAVHFERGRDVQQAIRYLERAGRNALHRSANAEAVRHLTAALALLKELPASTERTRQELTLHLALGTPLLALKGYGAPEVREHYTNARNLCRELGEPPELFPVLWGLWVSFAVTGELGAAEELGGQLFNFAERIGEVDLAFQAHHALWTTLVARGELVTCRFHVEQGLRLYQADRHHAQTFVYGGHDPGACCRIHGGFLYWLLGYPDHALRLSQEALALGKELSHPQTLAWALSGNAMVHQFRGEAAAAQKSAEEAIALSMEQQFALWAAYSPAVLGAALIAQGKKEQGLARIHAGLAALRATGTGLWQSQFLALLAEAYDEVGQSQNGLEVVAEALLTAERTGEGFYEAELYRLKGQLMLRSQSGPGQVTGESQTSHEQSSEVINPDPLTANSQTAAEACFLKALEIARRQSAKSWELRAAMSLARLWQSQGKLTEARELVEDIYGWFTEGFDTKDLCNAEALLTALGGKVKSTGNRQQTEEDRQKAGLGVQGSTFNVQRSDPLPDLRSPIPHAQDQGLKTQDLSSPTSDTQPPTPNTFRHEGEYWTLVFDGVVCRLRDMRGLHYLAYLLQHPDEEFHALRLVNEGVELSQIDQRDAVSRRDGEDGINARQAFVFSDSGEMLDPQARAAYRRRLEDLQAELEEASAFNDHGRIEQLQDEIELLTQALAQAVGLGGRARRAGSPAERARVTVTKSIKNALKKISDNHPSLGQYLHRTIKTGAFCSYVPAPRAPVAWRM